VYTQQETPSVPTINVLEINMLTKTMHL